MRFKPLGTSGLRVSELCLGTVNFGATMGGRKLDRREAGAVFEAFAEAGGNFFDTADEYQGGRSEEILGELIRTDRDRFVVATKYGLSRTAGRIAASGSSRRNMRRSLEGSLRRLGTDYVDVLYLHWWDFSTGWEEILSGFDELVRSGKVQYVAISNAPAWQISRAVTISELRGWERLVAVQLKYSLAERSAERELFPMAAELGLAVLGWGPLANGVLAGLYPGADVTARGIKITAAAKAVAPALERVARQLGLPPALVAHAWYRAQGARFGGQLFPIMGADTPAQIAENVRSTEIELPAEAFAEIDRLTAPDLGYPHEQLYARFARQSQRTTFGEEFASGRAGDPRLGSPDP